MPFTWNASEQVDGLAQAAVLLISSADIRAMSLRKLAAASRASPSGLVAHFDNKQRLETLIMHRVGEWVASAIRSHVGQVGSDGVLPDQETLPVVRAWLGLAELARSNEVLAESYAYCGEDVRDAILDAFALAGDDVVTGQTLEAVVIGLWTSMCARAEPMPVEHAQLILRHLCTRIGVPLRAGRAAA